MVNCINLIKMSINQNKKGFILNNNNKNLNILKAFIKLDIIKFIIIKNEFIIVYINYKNNKPVFSNIINILKPGCKKFISLKTIKKMSYKYNWILIISTSKGILNSFEAINKNVGGLLLAKIWN